MLHYLGSMMPGPRGRGCDSGRRTHTDSSTGWWEHRRQRAGQTSQWIQRWEWDLENIKSTFSVGRLPVQRHTLFSVSNTKCLLSSNSSFKKNIFELYYYNVQNLETKRLLKRDYIVIIQIICTLFLAYCIILHCQRLLLFCPPPPLSNHPDCVYKLWL